MARLTDITGCNKYLKSDCWRCYKAPVNPDIPLNVESNTGAHHWKMRDGIWICKYCYDVRKWPITFAAVMTKRQLQNIMIMPKEETNGGD